ncbi:MAG: cytochrome c oxidase subunit 2A [Anaerolineales bacterium]|nr:cytochrome c oxidase subunit 2A [Anaerolineales bacterium]
MDRFKAPQGTIAVVLIYLLIIIALWGSAYFTALSRGVTQ